jgi:predicted alpha-1,2-mannosidase
MNVSLPHSRGLFAAVVASLTGIPLICAIAIAQSGPPAPDETVDPFIGTTAGGNTFPGATMPFGMIQWGPDTRPDGWYHFEDHSIRGFSLTHLSGAGCPVYADVPILPWTGAVTADPSPETYAVGFSHLREQAHPGYYAVDLDNGVKVELTVTERAGVGRFMFPARAVRTLLLKAGSSATSDAEKRRADTSMVTMSGTDTVVGSVHSGGFCGSDNNYALYWVLKFAQPFSSTGTWSATVSPGSKSASGHKVGAYVTFPAGSEPILAKVGLSFVSIENAAANLQAEAPGWDFAAVHTASTRRWAEVLGRVRIEGGKPGQRTIFYTGLYHMLLSPNLFSDSNRDYRGFDDKVRRLPPGQLQYANFSDWDTYRDVVQFHALLFPEETSQMMQSLVRNAEQSGWLPRWPVANDVSYVMGGDSPAILLAEAYAFGARSFATDAALQYMVKGATQPGTGLHNQAERPGLDHYLSHGYLPVGAENEDAASITLEYATADFAISRLAGALGDHPAAAKLLSSSQNWRTLFDGESGFIRPRTIDGKFLGDWDPDHLMPRHQNWDPKDQLGFQEGSTWQYTWMIPHNYAGLIAAMGGNQNAVAKLDRFFRDLTGWGVPTFTVTNEPDFCAPYAYLWTGNPWKTHEVVDRIRRETFTSNPDGLPGNDDLGATSGVYVWNALGMYPVIPGVGGLALGTPLFSRAVVRMGNGGTLEILAQGEGIYVQSVTLNGKPFASTWLPLDALTARTNRLQFSLGTRPSKTWGTSPVDWPPSFDDSATR